MTDTGDVYEALLPTVLQQKVTWQEAAFNWRRLSELCGESAPGPADLLLPPAPRKILAAGVERLVDIGIGRQRANTLIEVSFSAKALQRAATMPTAQAVDHLQKVVGVGAWTASAALGMRLGRPESVIVGDLKLPSAVAWALAGEARGADARMVELLALFKGQAMRVVWLLYAANAEAPRRGPRTTVKFGRRF